MRRDDYTSYKIWPTFKQTAIRHSPEHQPHHGRGYSLARFSSRRYLQCNRGQAASPALLQLPMTSVIDFNQARARLQESREQRLLAMLDLKFPDDFYVDGDDGASVFTAQDEAALRELFEAFGLDWNPGLSFERLLAAWVEVHGNYGGRVGVYLKYPNIRQPARSPEDEYVRAVAQGQATRTRELAASLGLPALVC